MKKFLFLGAVALLALPSTGTLAVPFCNGPRFDELDSHGHPVYSEEELAREAEMQLRAQGINASMTRFWNGCIQTFVRENGHTQMKYYDPDTLAEVPVN
jgi:hypothetical protein